MAITTTCKVTYSLKPATVARVQELATKWNVPKSEVIRLAVEQANDLPEKKVRKTPLEALEWLQKNGISDEEARKFNAYVLRERRAWGRKRRG